MTDSVNEREEPAPQHYALFARNDNGKFLLSISGDGELKFGEGVRPAEAAEALRAAWISLASKSRSPAPAVEVDYLLAEEVIQRAVQGLDFAEDAQTIILPVKRCELEGVQMVAYIDGPTLEDLLCKSLDVERYRVVPAGRSPAPAITDAMVQAAIKSPLCPKCFAMNPWSREPSSCVDCVRTALTAALEVSGRSPAEVPPNDTQRLDLLDKWIAEQAPSDDDINVVEAEASYNDEDEREVVVRVVGDRGSIGRLVGEGKTVREAIDAAVGRSAQPHD